MKLVLLKGFISFAIALGVFIACLVISVLPPVGGLYKSPSESMAPSLNVGDNFYVSNYRYTFTDKKISGRGDIIVFRNPNNKRVMVGRVVGLPGDKIQMERGRLYINGLIVPRDLSNSYIYRDQRGRKVGVDVYNEHLPGRKETHQIYEAADDGRLDNTEVFHVPEGHVFMMGDNRDNSTDSRVLQSRGVVGYIPAGNIIGEAKRVLFQTNTCRDDEEFFCPPRRFFKKL